MNSKANVCSFSVKLVNVKENLKFEEIAELLYSSGCDDGTYGICNEEHIIDFDREAEWFIDAIESAKKDIERANVCEYVIIFKRNRND